MAGVEQLRRRLMPLMTQSPQGLRAPDMSVDTASYRVSEEGTINLLANSLGDQFAINPLGLERKRLAAEDSHDVSYQCASHEMLIFNTIGFGASSVVRRAIHIPYHRIVALKRLNVFDRDKRQQLLNEIRTLCETPCTAGLVEFYGAFFSPDSGQISIALEYMDGGSLADIVRKVRVIPEPILSKITARVLQGLVLLHSSRHLVHRDIKPANLLLNLRGEPKITDFGISAGLDNSVSMCATFVGTVTYMSPERINNERYSFPADIWSLGVALLECGTGIFPYNAAKGPVNLMLQVMYDPSPSPPADKFSPEFRDFVDQCLRKEADARPTAEQLLSHPFILQYAHDPLDLSTYVHSIFDPTERLKDLSEMLTTHYYSLFDGVDTLFHHLKTLYRDTSYMMVGGDRYTGPDVIFNALTELRGHLGRTGEKLVHVISTLECTSQPALMVRVMGTIAVGSQFVAMSTTAAEATAGASAPLPAKDNRAGLVRGNYTEVFVFEQSMDMTGSFWISKQETHIQLLC